jgi:hypothetical protein
MAMWTVLVPLDGMNTVRALRKSVALSYQVRIRTRSLTSWGPSTWTLYRPSGPPWPAP